MTSWRSRSRSASPRTLCCCPRSATTAAKAIHHVTPAVSGTAGELWLWAQGEKALPVLLPGARSWLGDGEFPILEFAVRNRPYLTAIPAPGEPEAPGVPDAALRDVADAALRAIRAGASASQVRRVIELSVVMPVIMATGRRLLPASEEENR